MVNQLMEENMELKSNLTELIEENKELQVQVLFFLTVLHGEKSELLFNNYFAQCLQTFLKFLLNRGPFGGVTGTLCFRLRKTLPMSIKVRVDPEASTIPLGQADSAILGTQ